MYATFVSSYVFLAATGPPQSSRMSLQFVWTKKASLGLKMFIYICVCINIDPHPYKAY